LAGELLAAAHADGWAFRALAREAGIGEAVPSAWRSGRSAPTLHPALLVGRVLGLRLDWEPTNPNESVEWTDIPPSARWRTYRRSEAARLVLDPSRDPVEYNAQLIGAELHWRRTQGRTPLLDAGGVAHGTQWALERGLAQGQGARSQLLRSYAAAGSMVGLRLVWLGATSPWRVRPWQEVGADDYRTP